MLKWSQRSVRRSSQLCVVGLGSLLSSSEGADHKALWRGWVTEARQRMVQSPSCSVADCNGIEHTEPLERQAFEESADCKRLTVAPR